MSLSHTAKAVSMLAAGALLAAAAPARADDAVTRTQTVKYTDLNLMTQSGQATLRRRIHLAALHVCGPAQTFSEPGYENFVACVQAAERTAQANTRLASN